MLWMTVFVFSIENRVTYACFKHTVYVVTSKMTDHSKRVQPRSVTLNLTNKFSQCTSSIAEHYDLFSGLIK